MKNIKVICIALVFLLLFVGVCLMIFKAKNKAQTPEIESFELKKPTFEWWLETFAYEGNVGEITDSEIAIEKAKDLWNEKNYDLEDMRIKVAYDSLEDCWQIYAEPDEPSDVVVLGGVYRAFIRSNGDVVAVWAED